MQRVYIGHLMMAGAAALLLNSCDAVRGGSGRQQSQSSEQSSPPSYSQPSVPVAYNITENDIRHFLPAGYKMTNLYIRDFNADGREDAIFTYEKPDYFASEEENRGHFTILLSTPSGYEPDSRTIEGLPHSEERNGIKTSVSPDNQPEIWVNMFGLGNHPDMVTYIFRMSQNGLREVGSVMNMTRSLGNGTLTGVVERRWDGECMACPQTIVLGYYRWNGNQYLLENRETIPKEVMAQQENITTAMHNHNADEVARQIDAVPEEYRASVVSAIPDNILGNDLQNLTQSMLDEQMMMQRVAAERAFAFSSPATLVFYTGARVIFHAQREIEAQQRLQQEQIRNNVSPPNYSSRSESRDSRLIRTTTSRSGSTESVREEYCLGCTPQEAAGRREANRRAEDFQRARNDVGAAYNYASQAATQAASQASQQAVQAVSSMAQQASNILGGLMRRPQ